MSKLALFLALIVALAPSISHALAENGARNFAQQICNSQGKVVTLNIVTTQGKKLATAFAIQAEQSQPNSSLAHSLEQCPFCGIANAQIALLSDFKLVFGISKPLSLFKTAYLTVLKSQYFFLTPPAQAPPNAL